METLLIKGLAILILLIYLLSLVYFNLRFRNDINWLLKLNDFSKPNFIDINTMLANVNKESTKYIFTAKKVANITFRGKKLTFIYGCIGHSTVGGKTGNMWAQESNVFVIVDSTQLHWIQSNADLFSPAVEGSRYSIYWVKLSKIKSEIQKYDKNQNI